MDCALFLSTFCLQVALVYGQMNEPPGARARVALTGLTVAEYFRDEEGQDVLLFIDNIFRYPSFSKPAHCIPNYHFCFLSGIKTLFA